MPLRSKTLKITRVFLFLSTSLNADPGHNRNKEVNKVSDEQRTAQNMQKHILFFLETAGGILRNGKNIRSGIGFGHILNDGMA